jgi:Gaa1-like, GPI transamidase component
MWFLIAAAIVLQEITALFMIPLLQRLMTGSAGASNSRSVAGWYMLKCLICCEAGLLLIALSTVNPSLALVISITTIPLCTLMQPTKIQVISTLQLSILVALSPPVLALMVDGEILRSFVQNAVGQWELYGAILLPAIVLIYWPLNMACQVMVGMEL